MQQIWTCLWNMQRSMRIGLLFCDIVLSHQLCCLWSAPTFVGWSTRQSTRSQDSAPSSLSWLCRCWGVGVSKWQFSINCPLFPYFANQLHVFNFYCAKPISKSIATFVWGHMLSPQNISRVIKDQRDSNLRRYEDWKFAGRQNSSHRFKAG